MAMTQAIASTRLIKRYPTRLNVVCRTCGRQAQAVVFLDQVQLLKCRKCGSRNASIVERDRCQQWARKRQGRS
jgi:hypothetical protein